MLLLPSYTGYIGLTKDAVLVIQAVLAKEFSLVQRRPHDTERKDLIRLGHVFVFIEEKLGIKRWTDGIAWLPSRILGRFLVYRELDKLLLREKDEKRRRRKRELLQPPPQLGLHLRMVEDHGLIKKTLSITTTQKDVHFDHREEKQTIHLILYYTAYDVFLGKLVTPLQLNLKYMPVLPALWEAVKKSTLGGKIPIEDEAYYFLDSNYQLQNMLILTLPVPDRTFQKIGSVLPAPGPGYPDFQPPLLGIQVGPPLPQGPQHLSNQPTQQGQPPPPTSAIIHSANPNQEEEMMYHQPYYYQEHVPVQLPMQVPMPVPVMPQQDMDLQNFGHYAPPAPYHYNNHFGEWQYPVPHKGPFFHQNLSPQGSQPPPPPAPGPQGPLHAPQQPQGLPRRMDQEYFEEQ